MHNIENKNGHRLNINNDSLERAWNLDDVKKTRSKMIRGEDIPACIKCVEQEGRGYASMRETHDMQKNFAITKEDGSVEIMPTSMELHLGNLCNLKCKMCGQQYSNQIGKELLEIGETDKDFLEWIYKESGNVNIWTNNLSVEYKWFQNEKNKNKLFEYVSRNIIDLVVIGGEPTVIPEFWELFEYLEQKDTLKNLSITLTTNLTNVNIKLINWLPKLKKWTIWASVDGIGERTEYIRYPSNFEKVCENLKFYKDNLGQNGSIVLSPAIQLLNIDQLDELLKWWLEFTSGKLNNQFGLSWLAQVSYPTICNYDILPREYKLKVADKLETSIDLFQEPEHLYTNYKNQIENLRKEVYTEEEKLHHQRSFIRYNDTQDRHRKGKTWRALLPDLEGALTKALK
jgi:organic radical activating enzyme